MCVCESLLLSLCYPSFRQATQSRVYCSSHHVTAKISSCSLNKLNVNKGTRKWMLWEFPVQDRCHIFFYMLHRKPNWKHRQSHVLETVTVPSHVDHESQRYPLPPNEQMSTFVLLILFETGNTKHVDIYKVLTDTLIRNNGKWVKARLNGSAGEMLRSAVHSGLEGVYTQLSYIFKLKWVNTVSWKAAHAVYKLTVLYMKWCLWDKHGNIVTYSTDWLVFSLKL